MHIRHISIINDDCQYECPYYCKHWKMMNMDDNKEGVYDRELINLPIKIEPRTYHFVKLDVGY